MSTHLQVPRTKEDEMKVGSRDFTSVHRKKIKTVATVARYVFVKKHTLASMKFKREKDVATLTRGGARGEKKNGKSSSSFSTICFGATIKSPEPNK